MTKNIVLCISLATGIAILGYVVAVVLGFGPMPPTFGGPV